MATIRFTEDEVRQYLAKTNPHSPVQGAKPKPSEEYARVREAQSYGFYQKVCIRVTVRAKNPPDPDNIDAKAAIDGIVQAGILRDDSAKEIAEVRLRSEIAEEDETVIEIWEVLKEC